MKPAQYSATWILALCLIPTLLIADQYEIITIAGTGKAGFSGDGGSATEAQINNPFGVIVGPDDNVYFCDTGNHAIRKIDRQTGTISTVAGTGGQSGYWGDGATALDAKLFEPYELRFNDRGDLFFVEMKNNLVRQVDSESGIISTLAGTGKAGFNSDDPTPGDQATFNRPHSIQFGPDFKQLFVCDIQNHRVRVIDLVSQKVSTFSGNGNRNGPADGDAIEDPSTALNGPRALDFDSDGNLWLALREGNKVVRFDMRAGKIHHVAGTGKKGFTGHGGPAKDATLSGPKGISVGPQGNIYLADTESHSIRMIDLGSTPPVLRLVAGTGKRGDGADGDPLKCEMARPHGVFVDPKNGDIYVGDSEAHKIRVIRKIAD
tara:strand:- start:2751 stop:3878 length:1128 start_codon:yes stop_codon:yes gene_type:complete